MKKIIFGITNLSIGGAEKTLVDLCNALCDKFDITIFTIYGNGELEKNINKKIKIINLFNNSYEKLSFINKKIISLKLIFTKKFLYKKYIKNKYDTEVAFLEGPMTQLFGVKNNNIKKIAWIHTDISLIFGTGIKSKIKKIINKKIYNNYNTLVFVSQNSLDQFNKTYKIKINKQVIHNYIDINNVLKSSEAPIDFEYDKSTINFLSVCRLVKSKAIDRLIRIHKNLIDNGYYHKIYIIGDGPEKNNLLELIKNHHIEKSFILLGQKENPYPYIKKCDYFCLLSYFEGYGIVLEEAKALSKNILITDTASKEALVNYNKKTIISNNENSIYDEFKKIISNNNVDSTDINYSYNNEIILNNIIEILGD